MLFLSLTTPLTVPLQITDHLLLTPQDFAWDAVSKAVIQPEAAAVSVSVPTQPAAPAVSNLVALQESNKEEIVCMHLSPSLAPAKIPAQGMEQVLVHSQSMW